MSLRSHQTPESPVDHRILFVDDDPAFLRTLQRMARTKTGWKAIYVTSAAAALKALRADPIDVVVSDIDMPGMNGTELLAEVQARHPDVVRVHLTGSDSMMTGPAAVRVAHQYYEKPLAEDRFGELLERLSTLRRLVVSKPLRQLVGESDELPPAPTVYAELTRCLSDTESTFKDIARIIGRDPSLVASVLKLVNSAFFGSPKHVTNVTEAVSFLGVSQIKQLVLTVGVFDTFEDAGKLPGFSLGYLQRHALLTALIARKLDIVPNRDDASLAGMLHELGQVILASRCPETYGRVLGIAAEGRPIHAVEKEILGVSHAEVGAYLLGLWGLPGPIVDAVAHHHDPARSDEKQLGLVHGLYVADRLAAELEGPPARISHTVHDEIDPSLLERLGAADALDRWRPVARKLAERVGAVDSMKSDPEKRPIWEVDEPMATPSPNQPLRLDEPLDRNINWDETGDERRRCFRVPIPPEHPMTVNVRFDGSEVQLNVKNLSVVTGRRPGGMLLSTDASTVSALMLDRWEEGTELLMTVALPDGKGIIRCGGLIVGVWRPAGHGLLSIAVRYMAAPSDREAILRVWLKAQRRAAR